MRLPVRTWLLSLCLLAPPALAQVCVPGQPQLYGELFEDAQAVLPDGKSLVDAIANQPPAAIVAEYEHLRARPGFDLRGFVTERFEFPRAANDAYRSDPGQDVRAHIDALWPVLERKPAPGDARSTLLPLPHRYRLVDRPLRPHPEWQPHLLSQPLAAAVLRGDGGAAGRARWSCDARNLSAAAGC